jgi:hypothetical protein
MKYNVHAYVVVRVTARAIEADSQVDAIAKFGDVVEPGLTERFNRGEDQNYAEDITGYHVDEEGDDSYARSRSYLADGVTPELPGNSLTPARPKVLVFVENGVSDSVADTDVQVEIFDKDNFDAGDDWNLPEGFENLAPAWLKDLLETRHRAKRPVGTRILSIQGEMAWVDGEGELETGPNAVGTVTEVLPEQEHCYAVVFDNGVWVFISDSELADKEAYRILDSVSDFDTGKGGES